MVVKTEDGQARHAPLVVHSFRVIAPRKLQDAERLCRQYARYEDIQSAADRMKWCRHRLGLMQREVAALVGVTRKQYMRWENGAPCRDRAMLDKLAKVFGVRAEELEGS